MLLQNNIYGVINDLENKKINSYIIINLKLIIKREYLQMIPKIIHYCWFGNNELPQQQKDFIKQWKEICPDWEIKLWNENNFNISEHPFAASAYSKQKYAFVSDYVRTWVLYKFGGVYLDTDIELKHSLNPFLNCEAFSCFETKGIAFTSAVWGSIKEHSLTAKMLNYYNNNSFNINHEPNTITITKILAMDYNINTLDNNNQIGQDAKNSIHIYASHYFCLDLPINYASHHFIGSWIDKSKTLNVKDYIHQNYYTDLILNKETVNKKVFLRKTAYILSFKSLIHIIRYYIKSKLIKF